MAPREEPKVTVSWDWDPCKVSMYFADSASRNDTPYRMCGVWRMNDPDVL